MTKIGNRIIKDFDRLPKQVIEAFRGIPSSNIGDMMNRLYCTKGLYPVGRTVMAGSAFTVKAPDGDNAFLHRALDLAKAGDVLVIDGGACVTRSLCGEIMFTYAQERGIEGFVVDGAIRDSDSPKKLDFAVYTRGVTPQGPYKNGPGEINVPVCCGGQVVFPGDVVVGDADGVCIVRRENAEEILGQVKMKFAYETKLLKAYHDEGIDYGEHSALYTCLTDKLKTEITDF